MRRALSADAPDLTRTGKPHWARYRVGPTVVGLAAEDSASELLAWADARHRGWDSDEAPDLTITLRRSPGLLRESSLPVATESRGSTEEVAFWGWRAQYDVSTGAAVAWLAADTTSSRGPARLEGIVRSLLGRHLLHRGGLALHAASMVHDGAGYLFVGARGAGKTTLVHRWPGERLLGDDHALVVPDAAGTLHLHATPYSGREGTTVAPGSAPLRRILVLEHAAHTHARALSVADSLRALLPHVIHIGGALQQVLDLTERLVRVTPVARLGVSLDDTLWPHVAQRAA